MNSGPPRRPSTTISSSVSGAAQRTSSSSSGSSRTRLVERQPGELERCALGAAHHLVALGHPRSPLAAEGDRQQVDQPVQGRRGVTGELLDHLEVEEDVVARCVAADPDDLDAVERVAGGHDRVGHHAGRDLDEHVVDGRAVVPLLDDLDRPDVTARDADGRRQAAQRSRARRAARRGAAGSWCDPMARTLRARCRAYQRTDRPARRQDAFVDLLEEEDRDLAVGLLLVLRRTSARSARRTPTSPTRSSPSSIRAR